MGVKTRSINSRSPSRYIIMERQFVVANAATDNNRIFTSWPFTSKALLVDLCVVLEVAGSITNLTVTPKKNNSTATHSTNPVLAVAAGVGTMVDSKTVNEEGLALAAGATKGIMSPTLANRRFSKGDRLTIDFAQSGTTTTGATCKLIARFEAEE